MLPDKLIRFLSGPRMAMIGTRSAELVPSGHRVYGWSLDAEKNQIRVHVLASMCGSLVDNLDDNGQVALTAADVETSETYQLKGKALSHEPSDAAAHEAVDRYLDSVHPLLVGFGLPPEAVDGMRGPPGVSVTIEVHQIFDQTPGPGAGGLIYPEAS